MVDLQHDHVKIVEEPNLCTAIFYSPILKPIAHMNTQTHMVVFGIVS